MAFVKITDNEIVGYAPIVPPSSEIDLWQEIEQDDPQLLAYLSQPIAPTPNWKGLENDLRGSAVWSRAFQAAVKSTAGNAYMTLIMSSLGATHNLEDLSFGFKSLRQVMVNQAALSDFTQDELTFIREALQDNGFDPEAILG